MPRHWLSYVMRNSIPLIIFSVLAFGFAAPAWAGPAGLADFLREHASRVQSWEQGTAAPPDVAPSPVDSDLANISVLLLDERAASAARLQADLPVHVAEDPLTAVVRGTGKVLENLNQYSKVLIKSRRY